MNYEILGSDMQGKKRLKQNTTILNVINIILLQLSEDISNMMIICQYGFRKMTNTFRLEFAQI